MKRTARWSAVGLALPSFFAFSGCVALNAGYDPDRGAAIDASEATEGDDEAQQDGDDQTEGGALSGSNEESVSASEAEPSTTDEGDDDPGPDPEPGSSSDGTGTPVEEQCIPDGVVGPGEACDDGNVDELDGCQSDCGFGPTELGWADAVWTETLAGADPVFSESTDGCPVGTVLVGMRGALSPEGWIGRVGGLCRAQDLANTLPVHVESTGSLIELPVHGGFNQGGDWELQCPEDFVVVGANLRTGSVIDQIELSCEAFGTVRDDDGVVVLTIDAAALTEPAGSDTGNESEPLDCPAGSVADGMFIGTSSYVLQLGLRCRTPQLR